MYSFKNDYTETAHPRILQALLDSNLEQDEGYGCDQHCAAAQESIKKCLGAGAAKADIHFLCGGTQSNLTVISACLRPHEAVLAAETAHICVHEAGAIEATGHTPGHSVFLVESEGKSLLILGDLIHAAVLQFPLPDECASYDMDASAAVKTRKLILAMAAAKDIPVAGMHIPFPGMGRVKVEGKGFGFTPLP